MTANTVVLNEGYINFTVGVKDAIKIFCCKIVMDIEDVIEEAATVKDLPPGVVK